MENTDYVLGKNLQVGDTINIWYCHRATVTELRPYNGPLAYLWDNDGGARLASFAQTLGMTIGPLDRYTLVHRPDAH